MERSIPRRVAGRAGVATWLWHAHTLPFLEWDKERRWKRERETGRYPGNGWRRRKEDRTSVELLIRV